MRERVIEVTVGLFILFAIASLLVLAFKVSGLTMTTDKSTYRVNADFSNIGGLKVRAPVTVAGVRIGQVSHIRLDAKTYKAVVTMTISKRDNNLPVDSTASIVTAGLLGANYIELTPGFEDTYLKGGDEITDTHPAIQLESMIGQLMFNMNKDSS